jgi:hypothetical protein
MNASLTERIRQFYDQSSHLWEEVWGEHMHHGYYGPEGGRRCDRTQAQVDLIEALLDWGQVQQASQILGLAAARCIWRISLGPGSRGSPSVRCRRREPPPALRQRECPLAQNSG